MVKVRERSWLRVIKRVRVNCRSVMGSSDLLHDSLLCYTHIHHPDLGTGHKLSNMDIISTVDYSHIMFIIKLLHWPMEANTLINSFCFLFHIYVNSYAYWNNANSSHSSTAASVTFSTFSLSSWVGILMQDQSRWPARWWKPNSEWNGSMAEGDQEQLQQVFFA